MALLLLVSPAVVPARLTAHPATPADRVLLDGPIAAYTGWASVVTVVGAASTGAALGVGNSGGLGIVLGTPRRRLRLNRPASGGIAAWTRCRNPRADQSERPPPVAPVGDLGTVREVGSGRIRVPRGAAADAWEARGGRTVNDA